MLNDHKDISTVDYKETGLKDGVLSKTNEPKAKGVGFRILDKFNKTITSFRVEKKGRTESGRPADNDKMDLFNLISYKLESFLNIRPVPQSLGVIFIRKTNLYYSPLPPRKAMEQRFM